MGKTKEKTSKLGHGKIMFLHIKKLKKIKKYEKIKNKNKIKKDLL